MTEEIPGLPDDYKPGLEDVIAGVTDIAEVDPVRDALTIRGYPAHEIAENAPFYEAVFLLFYGQLPTRTELKSFEKDLLKERDLSPFVLSGLKNLPPKTEFMNALRLGVGFLAVEDPDVHTNEPAANIRKAKRLVAKAASMSPKNFVRVDMEGSPYTQRTLDFVHELHRVPGNEDCVGAVIQSYMRRAEADIEKLLSERIRIRLCKGAYKEPEDIAFQKKSEVDASYVKLMKILMKSGVYHGLATHDEAIIKEAKAFATRENIPRNTFEFQMLHGIRRDLQQGLVKDGWGVRIYIPFGTEWYPYFMRRLAERPANVLFIAKNILRR